MSKTLTAFVPLLLAALPCTAATTDPGVSEASTQKQLPCDVVAHGMGSVLSAMAGKPPAEQCDKSLDINRLKLEQLAAIMPGEHPAHYYVFASRLFAAGRKDEAVFWFYAGQLRYRIRLACHSDLPRDVEPALFGSLQSVVGQTLNEYAGEDPSKWATTMESVLRWDAATPNGFEPKSQCLSAITKQRQGMQGLIEEVQSSGEKIRKSRAQDGLQNFR